MHNNDRSGWILIAVVGAFSLLYLGTGSTKNPVWALLFAAAAMALGYYFYRRLLERMLGPDPARDEAAIPVSGGGLEWRVFVFQFAAIASISALTGPVVAAQFGFLAAVLWIVVGSVLAGAVHDGVIMLASARADSASLGELLRRQFGPVTGGLALVLVGIGLLIGIGALAGLAVRLLAGNSWAANAFIVSIIAAVVAGSGLHLVRGRTVNQGYLLALGLAILLLGVLGGTLVKGTAYEWLSQWMGSAWPMVGVGLYLLAATLLPLRALSEPRLVLFGLAGLVGMGALAALLAFAAPPLSIPALVRLPAGSVGSLAPGDLFPFLILVVGGGAVSGYHALTAAGPSASLLRRPARGLRAGFGAMLAAGFLAVTLVCITSTLQPGDFFAIIIQPAGADLPRLTGYGPVELDRLANQAGQPLVANSNPFAPAAVAIARVVASLPLLDKQAPPPVFGYAFRLALVVQALFVLAGLEVLCRAARTLLEELLARQPGPLRSERSLAGVRPVGVVATAIIVGAVVGLALLDSAGSLAALLPPAGTILAGLGLALAGTYWWRHRAPAGAGRAAVFAVPCALLLVAGLWGALAYTGERYWPNTDPKVAFTAAYAGLSEIGVQQMRLPVEQVNSLYMGLPAKQAGEIYTTRGVEGLGKEMAGRMGWPEPAGISLGHALQARASRIVLFGYVQTGLTGLMLGLLLAVGWRAWLALAGQKEGRGTEPEETPAPLSSAPAPSLPALDDLDLRLLDEVSE